MINLEEILKRIEEDNTIEKTTKELKTLGLNDYYLKKACENGALEKISRGKYKVVAVEKNKKRIESFNAFVKSVFSNDFESAYENLVTNVKSQNSHDYDYHLKLYSIMLKELLPSDKDFSFKDDILTFCDTPDNETYFKYFVEFTDAVLSSNFDKAYKAIGLYRKEEKARKGAYRLSTKLFTHLAYNIQKQPKNLSPETSENTNQENLRLAEEKRQNYLFKENYAYLRKNIETENYEAALYNLENALKYDNGSSLNNLQKMQGILIKYLEIKSTKEVLPVQEIDYEECQDDYIKIFNKALKLKDYQTAYKNVGKCIYFNEKSVTLQLYRNLLRTLIEENNKNLNNNSVSKKESVKKELPKEEPKKVEENAKEEVVQEVEELPVPVLTMSVLVDLFYDRKYDEVKELLKGQENSDNVFYRSLLKMIRYMDNIRESNYIKEENIHFYKNDCTNCFKRFFESLNYRCYDEAFSLVDECIKLAERNNDSEKFIIYKYLLEDIISLKEEIIEKEAEIKKMKELTKIQNSILPKHMLKEEDFEKLKNATLEKIELSMDTDTSLDEHIVEMLETLKNIDAYKLDSNSFEKFEYSEKGILDKFLEAISLGDYQEAYQISREENWYQEMRKSENKNYLNIYKKLLFRINKKIEDNSKPIKVSISEEPLEENPLIEQLATLKTLVKNRKFTQAYNYYQENNLEGVSSELDLILQTCFPFITTTVRKQSIELEGEYKAALNKGNYEDATSHINEYEEFIKFNDLDRNIDYHKARIKACKLEAEAPDYVEKKQLYGMAYYYFNNRQFEKAIEILNEYISKDNDISPKGYLLRGRSNEFLKRFQAAKNDYEKALSIAPEPNVYHRLGKINYYSGDYEKALECFLEYEKRRPALHANNLEALSNTYQALGQEELSQKYKRLIKDSSKK